MATIRNDGSHSCVTATVATSAELIERIAQLEIGAGSQDDDLETIVHQIASQLPCETGKGCISTEHDCSPKMQTGIQAFHACVVCNLIALQRKTSLVRSHMGSMAQCRGGRGDALREAGAISAVLDVLWRLMMPLQHMNQWVPQDSLVNAVNVLNELELISLMPSTATSVVPTNTNFKSECMAHNHLLKNQQYSECIELNALYSTTLDLANSCLGALRDLSCGSALSRSAILEWVPPKAISLEYVCNYNTSLNVQNGIQLLCAYILRYHGLHWQDILALKEHGCCSTENSPSWSATAVKQSQDDAATVPVTERGKKELRILTNALGAIRNSSHSTPDNCQAFYECGLTDLLVWRLSPELDESAVKNNAQLHNELVNTSPEAPDNTHHWREAKYRTAGSLINLAEKCPSVATQLGSKRQMILLLIETWGGANAISLDSKKLKGIPLLHLGLAAILHAADDGALDGGLDDVMKRILEKEQLRKKVAQKKEEERKKRLQSSS
jgi:hypothetical protein